MKKFDLYYYDGLARQDEELRLTVGKMLSKLRQAWSEQVFLVVILFENSSVTFLELADFY